MASIDKNFKIKNGLIVGDSTNLVNYTSASPSGNFLGQLWIDNQSLYAWSSASTWVLIGDGNTGGGGGGGGTASGTPFNIPNTLIARSASGSFQIGSVDFHTASPVVSAIGRITWDDGEGTAVLGLGGGNVNLKIGQEEVARCYNGTGSTISKGSVVYISGAQGQRPSISLSNASSEITSSKTFGIAAESIADGAEGLVCTFGIVEGIDTSAFTDGSSLWLSASSGLMTNTIPVAPIHMVFVGYCIKSHATAGRIFVKPQNGYEIQELHNVLINGVNNTHILSYNSASSLWMNKDLQAAIKEVDGAGSGIDSDLLDGEQGSYYLDWTNTTNKPDPIIGVNLIGEVTGAASATLTDLANGQVSITTAIAPDSVILGTDTIGNYVAGATGGNGIIISGTAAEGWSPIITLHSSALTASVSGTSPAAAGSNGFRNITMSTASATGGNDGDVWLVYV